MTLSAQTFTKVTGKSGTLALGKELGRGGEGSVYEIVGHPEVAAKLYHKPMGNERAEKIEVMVSMQTESLKALTAWPLELLRNGGMPCGFLMPKVSGHKDIHNLYSPRSRKVEFPTADWRFLVRACLNVSKAFAELHAAGCVIGDINHGGIAISEKATVRLIDCDSFQVFSKGRSFLCEMGTPTFTPPELQDTKTFRGVVRTANHDNFGLAVMLFQLLLMGRHPFAGRFLGLGEMSLERAITEFRFAYGANARLGQMEQPIGAPALVSLSPTVVRLMERAFSREAAMGVRPTAKEWISALGELETQLKRCGTNTSHYYFSGLSYCPWCRVESATGAVLFNFNSVLGTGTGSSSEIAGMWQRITAIQPPGPAPALLSKDAVGAIRASDEAIAIGRDKGFRTFGAVAVIIVMIGFCVVIPTAWMLWIMAGLFLANAVGTSGGTSSKAIALVNQHRSLEAQHRSAKERWDADASDAKFSAKIRELEGYKKQWSDLPSLRQQRYQQLEREREKKQLEHFLDTFTIERASIPGIGSGRKAVLESYSIETAKDVTSNMKVPGFGPALTGALMEWRRSVARQFRFDANQAVNPRDIANLDREITELRKKLEQSLNAGAGELVQIRNQIVSQRKALEAQVNNAFRAMLQAEADMNAAKR
jgi:DNA-binding helix-hairpin-helix protein with protein kinase domain